MAYALFGELSTVRVEVADHEPHAVRACDRERYASGGAAVHRLDRRRSSLDGADHGDGLTTRKPSFVCDQHAIRRDVFDREHLREETSFVMELRSSGREAKLRTSRID